MVLFCSRIQLTLASHFGIYIKNVLATILKQYPEGVIDTGEVGLPIVTNNLVLPCGIYGRYESKN